MKGFKISILAMSLLALAGNAGAIDWTAICCDGGYEYRHRNRLEADKASADMAARLAALERERQRLADELATAQRQNANLNDRVSGLERQLADRDRELASLRSSAGDTSRLASQLSATQGELDQAKGRISDLEKSLAATEAGQAAARASSADVDRLNAELAAANNERSRFATELAALQGASGNKDKLAADLAAANNEKNRLAMELAALQGASGDKDRLAGDLAAANRRIADLERQLADRDRELAALRGELSTEMAKLKEAQRGLIRALRPQIERGDITVDLNNERLLINLASGYLFGTGEDTLKPAGADALKHVGTVLKDFPEYKMAVEGHTDNVPIRGPLKNRFPTNKELSEARAANAAKALAEGGLTNATTTGYADTKPVESNKTAAGRAKNRRVEVRVTR